MEFEKYKKDGRVAVLISRGFGGGWSTGFDEEGYSDFLCMDKGLILMHLGKNESQDVEEYIKYKTGLDYVFIGEWNDLKLEWLNEGEQFYIHGYDGSEHVVRSNEFMKA